MLGVLNPAAPPADPDLADFKDTGADAQSLAVASQIVAESLVALDTIKQAVDGLQGGNPAAPDDDEISPGVSRCFTSAARYPLDATAIAQLLGFGNRLILKVRVSRLDGTRDAIDLVAATVDARFGVVEHAFFGPDLVDGRAPARGVVFTEDVVKIADQQGRYAEGHGLSPLGIECGLRYLDPEGLDCSDLIPDR